MYQPARAGLIEVNNGGADHCGLPRSARA